MYVRPYWLSSDETQFGFFDQTEVITLRPPTSQNMRDFGVSLASPSEAVIIPTDIDQVTVSDSRSREDLIIV
jgi:hypothetical protein